MANPMEEQMKKRLIGAVTIISLVVIILPVIFDGSGDRGLSGVPLELPERPKFIFDQHFEGLPEGGEDSVNSLREEIDLRRLADGWMVQTGVFDSADDAKNQIATLLDYGYKARYTKTDLSGVMKYIVTLGPGKDRSEMEKMAQKIKEKTEINATVKPRREE